MVGRSEDGGVVSEWVFRHCAEAHQNLTETMEHSKREAGRYHPQGEFGAVYVSCDEDTSLRELDRRAARLGLRREDLLPRLMLTLHLRVQKVLDLTDEETRRAWGATVEEITSEDDYERCHEIARLARRDGFEAIRFPSFSGGGVNYAVFFDRLRTGSELVIQNKRWVRHE